MWRKARRSEKQLYSCLIMWRNESRARKPLFGPLEKADFSHWFSGGLRCLPPLQLWPKTDPILKMPCSLMVDICSETSLIPTNLEWILVQLRESPNATENILSYKIDFMCHYRQNTNMHCSCKHRKVEVSSLCLYSCN
jgi:hypothetical protein